MNFDLVEVRLWSDYEQRLLKDGAYFNLSVKQCGVYERVVDI